MSSHAKSSTAGPIEYQATGLGRIFRGVLATPVSSNSADGSGAPSAGGARVAGLASLTVALIATGALLIAVEQPA